MKKLQYLMVKNLQENKEYFYFSLKEVLQKQGIKITKTLLKKLGYKVYQKTYYLP